MMVTSVMKNSFGRLFKIGFLKKYFSTARLLKFNALNANTYKFYTGLLKLSHFYFEDDNLCLFLHKNPYFMIKSVWVIIYFGKKKKPSISRNILIDLFIV